MLPILLLRIVLFGVQAAYPSCPGRPTIVRVSSLENPLFLSSARKSSLFVLSVRFNRLAETATC